jgi:hypothetical protein
MNYQPWFSMNWRWRKSLIEKSGTLRILSRGEGVGNPAKMLHHKAK